MPLFLILHAGYIRPGFVGNIPSLGSLPLPEQGRSTVEESPSLAGGSPDRNQESVTNWHFSRSFHFLFYHIDTYCYSPKSYSDTNLHSLLSISPSNFVSDPQENQKRVYSVPKRSQHNAKTTTDGPFQAKAEATGLSNCPGEQQDQRPPLGSANRHDRSLAN